MSKIKPSVLLRVNVTGYSGAACTIYGAYDPNTDVLLIAKEAKEYTAGPQDNFVKITNQERDASHDAVFIEDDIREAIKAFFDLDALKLLNVESLPRLNPSNKIEREGMDANGMKFRIAPDITNGQVAVLAACLYAGRQRGFGTTQDFLDDMASITI